MKHGQALIGALALIGFLRVCLKPVVYFRFSQSVSDIFLSVPCNSENLVPLHFDMKISIPLISDIIVPRKLKL